MVNSNSLESYAATTFDLDHLPDAELIRNVENLKNQVKLLRLENEVLEATIMRLQPSLISGSLSALESAIRLAQSLDSRSGSRSKLSLHDIARSTANITSRSRSLHWKESITKIPSSVKLTRSIIGGPGLKINIEERLELVYAVMEAQGKDLKKARIEAKKKHSYLNAQFEELEIRTKDIEKLTADFEHEVVIEGVEAMTKRIPAETWIRFLTDNGKKIDTQIGKMRLRTSTINTHYIKLRADEKNKKDLAELILPIDFQVKAIEIKNKLETIEEINKDLIDMKTMTGDANLNLTRHKYDLMDRTNYLNRVKKLKIQRERQTKVLDAESAKLEKHVEHFEHQLTKIQNLREAYFVPDILEYVDVKLKISGFNHDIKRLETTLGIKQYALINIKKELVRAKILFNKMNLGTCKEESLHGMKKHISHLNL